MIRNRPNANIREIDGHLYIKLPRAVVEKSGIQEGLGVTFVTAGPEGRASDRIYEFLAADGDTGNAEWTGDANSGYGGAVLIAF